ncbi:MAG: hypothetical protein WBP12_00805 [Candidatus Saccharimonas sp.]
MADCYFHGYSGGPGVCSICVLEEQRGISQGSSGEFYDMEVTTHDWRHGRYGRLSDPVPLHSSQESTD